MSLGINSAIGVPLNKDGRFVADLVIQNTEPRVWTPEEITLLEETAKRIFLLVSVLNIKLRVLAKRLTFLLLHPREHIDGKGIF